MRGEYTKLRSAAMKRVRRAIEKDLGWGPLISSAYYRMPALRQLSAEDRNNPNVLKRLIVEATTFLNVEPTKISQLRKYAQELLNNMVRVTPLFSEFMHHDGGKQFFQYYQQASGEASEWLNYMEGKFMIKSKWDEEGMEFIRRDFEEWRRLNGFIA